MANKTAKVHPENCLHRKGTRDTDNYSEAGSCFEDPPRGRQEQNTNEIFINATEHVLEAAYCRVCLEVQQDGNPLVKACQCRDPIHSECLVEWVQHRMMESNDESRNLKCQICKQAYGVKFETYICFTCEIAKDKNRKFRTDFVQSLFIFLFILGLFLLDVTLLLKMGRQEHFSAELESILALPRNTVITILVMGLLFLGVFSLGLGYRLVVGYCYGTRWRVNGSAVQ